MEHELSERKKLKERIANLSGFQAKIALMWILQGQSLTLALEIAERWK